MDEDLKARIPAQLPMTVAEDKLIRHYCVDTGEPLGRLAVAAILEYIERHPAGTATEVLRRKA